MRRLQDANGKSSGAESSPANRKRAKANFGEAMDDDLNTSVALAALFRIRQRNQQFLLDANLLSKEEAKEVSTLISGFDKVLGVIGHVESRRETCLRKLKTSSRSAKKPVKSKDWKTADAIRQQLKAMGITIEDTAQGVRWKIEKA